MIVNLTDEEIKELNIICEYLDSNNSEVRNLGITLYNKYSDKFNSFIYDIKHCSTGPICIINIMRGEIKIPDVSNLSDAIYYIMFKGEVFENEN